MICKNIHIYEVSLIFCRSDSTTGCLRSSQNEIPAIEFHLSPHCSTFKVEFLSINTHLSAVVVVVDGLAAEKEILHTYMDRITSRR